MTYEEKIASLRHLLREAPDVLSPLQIARWTHQSKNTVYALIKSGRLTAYAYHGGFLVAKVDLIEYMADTTDYSGGKRFRIGGGMGNDVFLSADQTRRLLHTSNVASPSVYRG